jgi:antitoxin HicB
MADGETIEEAIASAMDAEYSWLETVKEKECGDPIPESSAYSGKWVQRVPKSIHARIAARAIQEGVSINSLVASFIAQGLSGEIKREAIGGVWRQKLRSMQCCAW